MWVITVFEENNVRAFQFDDKQEATIALEQFKHNAIMSFTN